MCAVWEGGKQEAGGAATLVRRYSCLSTLVRQYSMLLLSINTAEAIQHAAPLQQPPTPQPTHTICTWRQRALQAALCARVSPLRCVA